MRELKFRGWCEGSYEYDIVAIDETTFMDGWDGWVLKGEVEQHTGLKDKNGKEIYEGDILKCPVGYEDYTFNAIIGWNKEEARFGLTKESKINLHMRECEVIGNIHENKELLK